MQLPTFALPTSSLLFEEGFRRFLQERFPTLALFSRTQNAARRYGIHHQGKPISEIETLPINGENQPDSLEIRVASLNQHWSKLDGQKVTPSSPRFCSVFYRWAQERYSVELPSPDPRYKSMADYVSVQEFTQGMFGDWENVTFDDPNAEATRRAIVADNQRGLVSLPEMDWENNKQALMKSATLATIRSASPLKQETILAIVEDYLALFETLNAIEEGTAHLQWRNFTTQRGERGIFIRGKLFTKLGDAWWAYDVISVPLTLVVVFPQHVEIRPARLANAEMVWRSLHMGIDADLPHAVRDVLSGDHFLRGLSEYLREKLPSLGGAINHAAGGDIQSDQGNSAAILRRIDEMQSALGLKLDDLKRSQWLIYQKIEAEARSSVDLVVEAVREESLSQGEIQNALDAIRRVLRYILKVGLPVNDLAIKQSLADIYESVNSNTDLRQRFELSLPVIPLLLEYKVELDAGVDLVAVWKELTERARNKGEKLSNSTPTK